MLYAMGPADSLVFCLLGNTPFSYVSKMQRFLRVQNAKTNGEQYLRLPCFNVFKSGNLHAMQFGNCNHISSYPA